MPIPSNPPRLENVIGTQADVFTIPETTPEGTSALSYQSGWPTRSATALSAGGVPPQREYFNAVNKLITQHIFFQQSGGVYQWSNQNDYLQGAHVLGSDGKEYVAAQQSGPDTSAGVQDPTQDTSGTYWVSAGSAMAEAGGGLEVGDDGLLYVAKLKTARALDGVNFDGSAPVKRYAACSTAAGTAAKTVSVTNFTLVEGATLLLMFANTNTAANPTLNVSGTGAKPIRWRGAAVTANWLAANRLYMVVYNGTAWEIVGDLVMGTIQSGGGLAVDSDGQLFVDFSTMPTDKFEDLLKSLDLYIWLTKNTNFYVNGDSGSDSLDPGRGLSAELPFKTIQACVDYLTETYNIASYVASVNIAEGEYVENVQLPTFNRTSGYILIRPQTGDEGKVTVKSPMSGANTRCFRASGQGYYYLRDLDIVIDVPNDFSDSTTGTVSCLVAVDTSSLNVEGCRIKCSVGESEAAGKMYVRQLYVAGSAYINIRPYDNGNTELEFHKGASPNFIVFNGESNGSFQILGTDINEDMVNIYANGECDVFVNLDGRVSFTRVVGVDYYAKFVVTDGKTVTGSRYRVVNGAACYTRGGGEEFFPGDTAGYVETSTYSIYS